MIRLFVSTCFSSSVVGVFLSVAFVGVLDATASTGSRPNILWLTSEDNGPELGCYGDDYADTPNIDRLASRGMMYLNAWSTAPVCAPARTTIISGMYPPSTGSQHMRSIASLPKGFQMFPQTMREAGYYCTNNSKEDYSLKKPGKVWDESSKRAHWKKRKPGQPFFAVFNSMVSHESQIRKRPHGAIHDPAKAPIPPYHPDVPEVRQDWAQYYDKVTEMDARIGLRLQELEKAGLADDTIVIYFGDHGSGMPRSKRWLYQSGLRVPMIVYVPEKFRHLITSEYHPGAKSKRLIGFIDLAPTVLSLAGITTPQNYQGHAFLSSSEGPDPQYLYGFRDRMDERVDLSRCVRDERYLYIRNYMPHKPRGQFLDYMFRMPTTIAWKQLYDQGELSPPQSRFWEAKAPEELYDISRDPHQINNLADSQEMKTVLLRLRKANRSHLLATRDTGFLPEGEVLARCEEITPYELGHDNNAYPLERILDIAEKASMLNDESTPELVRALTDTSSGVRYWAALGLFMRGEGGVGPAREKLLPLLEDSSLNVRIVAAEALARYGQPEDLSQALEVLVELSNISRHPLFVSVAALGALDDLDEKALSVADRIKSLPTKSKRVASRYKNYIPRLLSRTLSGLEEKQE